MEFFVVNYFGKGGWAVAIVEAESELDAIREVNTSGSVKSGWEGKTKIHSIDDNALIHRNESGLAEITVFGWRRAA